MNNQRRTFRGRGGPTDGRLPKHNARRRRLAPDQRPHKPATNKYHDDNDNDNDNAVDAVFESVGESDNEGYSSSEESSSSSPVESELAETAPDQDTAIAVEPTSTADETVAVQNNEKSGQDERSNPCVKEVQHLKKRVRNIRETMSLSHSIVNPTTYQDNVLKAASNCVNEWRSIVTHYPPVPEDAIAMEDDATFYMTSELRKPAALTVFEMIQQAIQSGPLAGSKPGYFKRCGGEVAKEVKAFLDEVIPHAPALIQLMGFTPKQMDAMAAWRKNAQKAALENKPPSRTASKYQQCKGTGKKAKKNMKGK